MSATAAFGATTCETACVAVNTYFELFGMYIVSEGFHSVGEFLRITIHESVCVAVSVPIVIQINIGVAGLIKSGRNHGVSHFFDGLFVNILMKEVPAAPSHRWCQC